MVMTRGLMLRETLSRWVLIAVGEGLDSARSVGEAGHGVRTCKSA